MKKIKHKKLFAISLISCAAVATAGIGYASWVISTETSQTLDNISVTADNVDDRRTITLGTPALDPSNGTVRFGPVEDDAGAIRSETSTEDMTFAFTIDVTAVATANGTVTMTPTWPNWDPEYIVTPCTTGTAVTIATVTNGTVAAASETPASGKAKITPSYSGTTLTVTVEFAWGSYFKNHNPATPEDYFGGDTGKALDDAVNALNTVAGYTDNKISILIAAVTA